MRESYKPLVMGIAAGFFLAILDVVGVFNGRPVCPWLQSPYIVGLFIVSLSFAWTFLSQYSWIFITLTKSQHEIERLVAKSNRDFVEFVHLIAKTLDAKDKYTAGHSLRVMDYAVKIAHALQLPDNEIELLKQACLLHDIGKISIPDGILNKKKKLTQKERKYIFEHPVVGKKILSTVSEFKDILDIIYSHHERVDGTGYPDGRMKNDIPFLARILAVADAYDAMRSERPYRPARNQNEALEELILAKGSQLDAEVVDIFIKAISSV
jgi:putative nucleotidyltransferase with HDIG domain